jgi:putative transposase
VLIPRKESNAMKRVSTTSIALAPADTGAVGKAWDEVSASFDRFCLAAGVDALGAMMENDAEEACGARHVRSEGRRGHRWGRTQGKIGFHAGKVAVERPRVRDLAGQELVLPSWDRAVAEDWLGKWAMNLMLINVSTRKFRRAVRLPEGDVPAPAGAGVSKSAASRHFVALSAARMKEWMGADLSGLDIMVVQIDGIHISEHLVLVAALGIDSEGFKHPLGLMEGATEHRAVVQALIDDLIERGLDPAVPRLFIIDGSKALAKAIRRSFGRHTPIQRCQVHKARNIMERLSPALHAPVRRALRIEVFSVSAALRRQRSQVSNLVGRARFQWLSEKHYG